LFSLLEQQKIKPLSAQRFPLAEARHAHELPGPGGKISKLVFVYNGSSLESGTANVGRLNAWLTPALDERNPAGGNL